MASSLTTPFRPSDIPTGLVGYWKFNNDATDSSASGYNLTAVNSPTYTANGNYWKDEYCATLSGTSQYFQIAKASSSSLNFSGSSVFTTHAQFKLVSSGGGLCTVISRWNTNGYHIYASNTAIRVYHNGAYIDASCTLSDGKWYFLDVVDDGVNDVISVYIDGNLVSSQAMATAIVDGDIDFFVGTLAQTPTSGEWFGNLKDVAIWNVALTPLQIKSLALGVDLSSYAYRPNNVSTQPTAWWKLNEVSGNAVDSSGSHTGTDTNSVLSSGGYIEGIARDFEASASEYFAVADSDDWNFGTGSYSFAFWSKWESVGNMGIIDGGYGVNKGISIFLSSGNKVEVYSNGVSKAQATFVPVAETWYHIAIVRTNTSAGGLKIYIDGVDKTTSGGEDTTNVDGGTFGYSIGVASTVYHDGELQDVAIWKGYALSDAEIKSLACSLPIQRQGMMSYWKMDEASGNAIDSFGSNTGVETSGTIDSTAGMVGNCRDFEAGDTEYFSVNDSADFDWGTEHAMVVWAKPETLGTNYITSRGTTPEYHLIVSSTPAIQTYVAGGLINSYTGTPNVANGTWGHISWSRDGAVSKLYFNSAQVDSDASTDSISSSNPIIIGASGAITGHYDGLLDEFVMFKRYLRPEEIKAVYLKGLNGKEMTSTETSPSTGASNFFFFF